MTTEELIRDFSEGNFSDWCRGKFEDFVPASKKMDEGEFEAARQIGYVRTLAEDGVNSLLVEGGARVSASFRAAGLVDEVSLFLAPKLLGRGLQMGESWALRHLTEGIDLRDCRIRQAGDDLLIEGTPSCSPDW